MTISTWLIDSTKQLKDIGITSNRLDAELILAHTLRRPRTYLHAHLDEEIDSRREEIADARLRLRLERTPLAYIVGHKEFYGRHFRVTPDTLIPRPESETLMTILLELTASEIIAKKLIDVGTGSGALGITAKLERPHLEVTLTDISRKALAVAEQNADRLDAPIVTQQADLLNTWFGPLDYIIANLPYVDETWDDLSPEIAHEPRTALFASHGGLQLIYKLIPQAARWLDSGGYLLLEADPTQHKQIIEQATRERLKPREVRDYCIALQKD